MILGSKPCNPKPGRIPFPEVQCAGKEQTPGKACPTTKELMDARRSNVIGFDVPVVHAAVDELVGSVSRHVGDLNRVVDLVVHLTIGALHLGNLVGGNTTQVGFDFDELGHAFCGTVLGHRRMICVFERLDIPSSTCLGAPEFWISLE